MQYYFNGHMSMQFKVKCSIVPDSGQSELLTNVLKNAVSNKYYLN